MEWVSVKDRLPANNEDGERILAYGIPRCGNCGKWIRIEFCKYHEDIFQYGEYSCPLDATHWMKLPEPPKE